MSAFSSAILQSRQNLYIFIVKYSNLQGPASLSPPPPLPPSLPSPISHSFSSLPPIFFIQISPIMKFNAFFLLHYFFLIFLLPFSLLNLPALSFPFLFCFHYQFSFSLLPSLLFSLFISSTKYGDFHVNKIKFYSKVLTCNTNIFQYFISQFVE